MSLEVISLHGLLLPETEDIIQGTHLASMRRNAILINTSRGVLVREVEMVEVLGERPDLWAVLDVTHPEPPEPDSCLYDLPNVGLTPHISGSRLPAHGPPRRGRVAPVRGGRTSGARDHQGESALMA